jgi:hypothetical protein
LNAVLGSGHFSSFACVALIYVSQLDVLLGDLLFLAGQFSHLCTILFIGRRDMQC